MPPLCVLNKMCNPEAYHNRGNAFASTVKIQMVCKGTSMGRTALSGDRAQPSFLFLKSKKSKVGRRGLPSDTLGQAWNGKRGSQLLQLIFFDFGKPIRRDFVGENLPQTPSMIGESCGHRWRLFQVMMAPTEIVGASNQIHSPLKGREVPIGMPTFAG